MSGQTLALRVVPPGVGRRLLGTGGARYLVERNLLVYRNGWAVLVSGIFEPIFYLFSIGIGIAALVGDVRLDDGTVVSYTAFVAPAMLASSAMNGAMYDATFNLFFKLKYNKLYDAVLSTPVTPVDVAVGEIGWALSRATFYAATFLVVMLVMGLIGSWWALLALPAVVLIGFSFAAVGCAHGIARHVELQGLAGAVAAGGIAGRAAGRAVPVPAAGSSVQGGLAHAF